MVLLAGSLHFYEGVFRAKSHFHEGVLRGSPHFHEGVSRTRLHAPPHEGPNQKLDADRPIESGLPRSRCRVSRRWPRFWPGRTRNAYPLLQHGIFYHAADVQQRPIRYRFAAFRAFAPLFTNRAFAPLFTNGKRAHCEDAEGLRCGPQRSQPEGGIELGQGAGVEGVDVEALERA